MWYGVLIAAGMLLGIALASYTCKFRDVKFDPLLDIVLLLIPISVVGARLYYVIFNLKEYSDNWLNIFNTRLGGLAIHGGIIFAFIFGYFFAKSKKISYLDAADVAAVSFPLAQSIGRWGNFFNQEVYGGVVSKEFISHFPKFIQNGMYIDGEYHHPTFLYESIWDLLVFVVVFILIRKSKKKGIVFFTYIGLYSIGRFIIEGIRTDYLLLGSLRQAQIMSVIGVLVWIGYLLYIRFNKK